MHVISLSSVHSRDLDATTHQVAAEEDKGSRVVQSRGIAFVLADGVKDVLEISPDGVAIPITKVVCQTYRILLRSASLTFDCTSNWLHASFTARESVAYMEGPIRIRRETPALTTLMASFQDCLDIASLQCALLGHQLTALDMPPASTLCPNLARMRGGAGNADSNPDGNAADAAKLQLNARTNATVADPPT